METKTKQLQSITEAAKLALNKQHINSKLRNKHLTDSHVPLEEFKVRSVFLARRCLEAKKEIDKKRYVYEDVFYFCLVITKQKITQRRPSKLSRNQQVVTSMF